LIELLVVIAIIAILAAILFPVFAQAREKARAAACLSNEKQIGLGITMYLQDYDETYPMAWTYGTTYTALSIEIQPYVQKINTFGANNTAGIWRCPDDSVVSTNAGVASPMDTHQTYVPVFNTPNHTPPAPGKYSPVAAMWDSIALAVTDSSGNVSYAFVGKQMGAIPDASGTIMMVETCDPESWLGSIFGGIKRPYVPAGYSGMYSAQNQLNYAGTSFQPAPGGWHTGGWNYVYADGHVKFAHADQTVGKGEGGNGNDYNGGMCYWSNPCGGWTLDPND
jgi:prepilin-type processing-associated H-X9-DG protein